MDNAIAKKIQFRHSLLLLVTALIWGAAFVAQSVGMDYVGPYTFNAVRFLLGAVTLTPLVLVRRKTAGFRHTKEDRKLLLKSGILCGVALGISTNLQQLGILYTSVGKAGFLTALYIVLVPVMGIFVGRKAGVKVWAAVVLAMSGLYFLCMKGGDFSIGRGELLCILCAFGFTVQIYLIDRYSGKVDGVELSVLQFLVSASISGILMAAAGEQVTFQMLLDARVPILYAGILSCGVAYTLQIIGQRGLNPAIASLIMSLESPISVLAGFLVLRQVLSGRELAGCAMMAFAIILAQI